MKKECVLQQLMRVCRELLKWKNCQTGGLGPFLGPQWVQGEGRFGEQEVKPPAANGFIDFTHLRSRVLS